MGTGPERLTPEPELGAPPGGNPPGSAAGGLGPRGAVNAALLMVARVLSRVLALVAILIALNSLGADGFGRLQTLVTYTALVAVVPDLGFNLLYIREGARHPEQLSRYLSSLLSAKALLLLLSLGVLAAVLRLPGLEGLLLPAYGISVLAAFSSLLRGTFYATGRLTWEAVDIVLESVVVLGLFAIGVATHQGVAYFLWSYAASYGVSCLWFAAVIRLTGMASLRPRWDGRLLRSWTWTGLPLALTALATNVYFKVDGPILAQFRPFTEVGWYAAAYKPFEALVFIPVTIRQVAFPILSVYHHSDRRRLQSATEMLFRGLLLCGWPCTVGLFVLAPNLNAVLRLSPESEPALRLLALALVVMFVDSTFIASLNAMDRQAVYARIIVAGLVVNLLLDFLLIPSHGYLGAATATVITEVALASTGWAVLARNGIRLNVPALAWRILAAGLGTGLLLLPLRGVHGWGTVAAVLIGAMAYGVLLVLLRAFNAEEISLACRALQLIRGRSSAAD